MRVNFIASFKLSKRRIPRMPISSSSSFLNAVICHLLSALWKSPIAIILLLFPRSSVPPCLRPFSLFLLQHPAEVDYEEKRKDPKEDDCNR